MCVGVKIFRRFLFFGGVVLNVSSFGVIYFMEFKEVVDLNNMEVWLVNFEKDEERVILSLFIFELGKLVIYVNCILDRI